MGSRQTAKRPFGDLSRKAKEIASDKEALNALIKKAKLKAFEHKGALQKFWQELMALLRLLKAWGRGSYQTPWKTVLAAIGAVLYFLNPFDLIPDFLSAVGFLDDASIIALVYKSIQKDIHKFLEWEKTVV